ncbi:MAG: flavoprotein oxidoreductase, partial [Thermoleophilia bacterium]|nr:flavoprotein oxidoreductase [Thermoleophilia bacterium]
SEPMTIKLIGEVRSGRLLGGQIVGGAGAAVRINVVAAALQAGMTAQQVAELDLAYAPPFSSVWDPVLLAGRQLSSKL